ncbi:NfeD family protein [Pandoraea nosoerga]|uniref:NfeD-like family protein 1 n=1 Tax=Pandoraea nosoerga TaxID=2508296 RepID=A0A5E4VBT6_9BURK|nr:NfeD family protein [Pandoraea nosoerga]MBN4666039.1 NfeD family protein [Pandoraea nosoerga]MBN4676213.1 NfeD family protein [Pandoraea nosoerga]MBN4681189.1 NfeD family protein [Pandoraea nosoerga]MBN4745323.1 NfeD family protein [Pandoraea nosoerga]VVE09034.1 NfeD-like family protein 1 [Pandoraea nosoerga]
MEQAWLWFGVAGLTVVLELASGTFYLLMVALGMVAGGVAAVFRVEWPLQWVVAAVVAGVAVWLLRRSRFGRRGIKADAAADPNTNLDIGQQLRIEAWQRDGRARAMYRGAEWDVELLPGELPNAGWFVIREVRGSRLYVANVAA